MATENTTSPEKQPLPTAVKPVVTSCRKKKSDDATFMEDLKDHIDQFIHASMDEHKACFKETIQKMFAKSERSAEATKEINESMQKMFGRSNVVAERRAETTKEVESSLPLQTTVAE